MSVRGTVITILFIIVCLLIANGAFAQERDGEDEGDLEGANGAREEYIRRQKREREDSQYDKYGCPKQAPYFCTTDPFTLQMICACGGGGGGRF